MFQHECADKHLSSYWKELLRDNLAEVFQSHQTFETDLEIMRQSLTVFLNSSLQDRTFERPNRYKRSLLVPIVGTALGSELSRIFLRPFTAPIADKFSCFVDKLVPFGSLCQEDERKKVEALARQVKNLEENVFYLKSKMLEAITVRMPADVDRTKLSTLKRSLQENVEMLNETIRGVLEEIKDYVEKGECVARHIQDRHPNTLIIAASLQKLTIQYRRLVNDVNQQRISLANMASLMQDAMASLVHGYLPIALIPPTIISKISGTFGVYGLNKAIPRKLIAAYFTFEVVRDAYISDEGLHLLIEIPLYTRHGVHDVIRATPTPQPIPQTERVTQYHLSKTQSLMSWDKTSFAEVTEQELHRFLGLAPAKTLRTTVFDNEVAEDDLLNRLIFQSSRYRPEILCPRRGRATSTSAGPVFVRFDVPFNILQGRFYNAKIDRSRRNSCSGMSKLPSEALL